VGVLDRQLGAPGAAELLHGGRQQHDRPVAEQLAYLREQVFAPHEVPVARRQTATDRHTALPSGVVLPITVRGIIATAEAVVCFWPHNGGER
jgi:hypothetical protein